MNKELMMRRLLVAVAVVFIAGAAFAVSPIPPYTVWPCDPNAPEGDAAACSTPDPNDCYSYRSYSPSEALQHRTGNGRSPRSTDKPVAPYGICSGFHQWCSIAPEIGAATYAVIQNPDGGRDVLFNVEYDFPNNYCQVYDDGPPCYASVFPPYHVIEIPPVRLMLVDAATNAIIHSAPAVFEAGTWKPRISISCDDVNRTFRVIALAGGGVGQCTAKTAEKQVKVEAPAAEPNTCNADKWCPDCSGFPSGAAGKPTALGSGDVSVEQPLFSIQQSPMPLSFGLTYHSERPIYPHLVDYPLGLGWSHTFNDTLRVVDQPFALTLKGTVLYRHDGKGHERNTKDVRADRGTRSRPRSCAAANGSRSRMTSSSSATGWMGRPGGSPLPQGAGTRRRIAGETRSPRSSAPTATWPEFATRSDARSCSRPRRA